MGLVYENNVICIFININKNVENRGETEGKTIDIARFWMGYKIYLAPLEQILMAASMPVCGLRNTLDAIK